MWKNYSGLILMGIFSAIVILVTIHLNYSFEQAGQIGDSFGVATSIFTLITLIGLLVTIAIQREDLKIAREAFKKQGEELELTREQIKISNSEFEQQNLTLRNQRFESTFFNMLQRHDLIAERAVAKDFFNSVVSHCRASLMGKNNFNSMQETYRVTCQGLVRIHLSQYIRNFQKIIELIFQFETDPNEIKKYLGIYFAQLTQIELELICYHFSLKDTMVPQYFIEYHNLFFGYLNANPDNYKAFDEIKKHFQIIGEYDSLMGSYSF